MYDCSGKSKKWGKFAKKILTKVWGAGILTERITEAQLIPGRSEKDSGDERESVVACDERKKLQAKRKKVLDKASFVW